MIDHSHLDHVDWKGLPLAAQLMQDIAQHLASVRVDQDASAAAGMA
jgi:hypothetical protein